MCKMNYSVKSDKNLCLEKYLLKIKIKYVSLENKVLYQILQNHTY